MYCITFLAILLNGVEKPARLLFERQVERVKVSDLHGQRATRPLLAHIIISNARRLRSHMYSITPNQFIRRYQTKLLKYSYLYVHELLEPAGGEESVDVRTEATIAHDRAHYEILDKYERLLVMLAIQSCSQFKGLLIK